MVGKVNMIFYVFNYNKIIIIIAKCVSMPPAYGSLSI